MKTNATEFKNHLGKFMQKVHREPIFIENRGEPSVVLISQEEYDRLSHLEDYYWNARAEEGIKSGILTPKETQKRLQKLLEKAEEDVSKST